MSQGNLDPANIESTVEARVAELLEDNEKKDALMDEAKGTILELQTVVQDRAEALGKVGRPPSGPQSAVRPYACLSVCREAAPAHRASAAPRRRGSEAPF